MSERVAIVTGSRYYADSQGVCDALDEYQPSRVIQGGATGADFLALMWAKARGIPWETFNADWKTHGRSAGPIRNREMIERGVDLQGAGHEVVVLAFPGGPGTENMIRTAIAHGLTVKTIGRREAMR